MRAACGRFRSRLQAVVDDEGGYCEGDGDYKMWAADRIFEL